MDKNKNGKIPVGLGIGMIVAGIAGAYYLYGSKEGPKNRAKVRGWMLRAKGEVLEKIETLRDIDEQRYNEIIDKVLKKYSSLKNIDRADVEDLVKDLRKHWGNIKKYIDARKEKSEKGLEDKPKRRAKKKTT